MIARRWRRATPTVNEGPGVLSRVSSKISQGMRRAALSLVSQQAGPAAVALPAEGHDYGPFGRMGVESVAGVKKGTSAAGRAASSPFGAVVTVSVTDAAIRVLIARGNRVRRWGESALSEGVVQDGLIVDEETFVANLNSALSEMRKGPKLNGAKVAVAIGGRNVVQRRFTLFVDEVDDLPEAIVEAGAERMSIKPEEFQLAWDAALAEYDLPDDGLGDGEAPAAEAEETLQDIEAELAGVDEAELGDPYDVYAFGMYQHVLRRDLRTLADSGARFAAAQPTAMALSAAANRESGIIIDVEADSLLAIVLRDGLPEVIREAAINPRMSEVEWTQAVTTQLSRAVAFHDSMYPDSKLAEDAPLFVTGSVELAPGGIDAALSRLPYVRTALPYTLRAPAEFPFDRYAANVGLALLAGKRWWQRTRVPIINRARFDFLPDEFRPRTLPLRAIATAAMAIVFIAGLFAGYEQVVATGTAANTAELRRDSIGRQVQIRNARIREVKTLEQQITDIESETIELIASADLIRVRDRGISDAMTLLADNIPAGVAVEELSDDGKFISILATSGQYAPLLQYAQSLELLDEFDRVRVRSIGSIDSGSESSALIEIEITRVLPSPASTSPRNEQSASAR